MKDFLKGKKTYILAGVAIVAVWLDYFLGIGLSSVCSELEDCAITTQEAIAATWAAVSAATIRAGIAKV